MIDKIYNLFLKYKLHAESIIYGGEIYKQYDDIKIPYSGDGDLQEIWYHRNAKEWAKKERNMLGRYIGEGDIAIDVGANIGFLTVIIGNMIGRDGKLLSFEPSQKSFRKLKNTIVANNLVDVVEAFNRGCGSEKDTKHLYHVSSSSGLYTTKPAHNSREYKREEINIVVLDEFIEGMNVDSIDFIKIDTEGYEYEVLKGSKSIIKSYRPFIYLELCKEYKNSSRKSVNFLRELNYHFESDINIDELNNGSNFLAQPM